MYTSKAQSYTVRGICRHPSTTNAIRTLIGRKQVTVLYIVPGASKSILIFGEYNSYFPNNLVRLSTQKLVSS